jgi:hypothetical protein
MGIPPSEEMRQNLAPGNVGGANLWYVIASIGSIMLLMRVFLVSRKAQKRYADSQLPQPPLKRRYQGDIEFDRIRVETIELDDD